MPAELASDVADNVIRPSWIAGDQPANAVVLGTYVTAAAGVMPCCDVRPWDCDTLVWRADGTLWWLHETRNCCCVPNHETLLHEGWDALGRIRCHDEIVCDTAPVTGGAATGRHDADGVVPDADLLADVALLADLDTSRLRVVAELLATQPHLGLVVATELAWADADTRAAALSVIDTSDGYGDIEQVVAAAAAVTT